MKPDQLAIRLNQIRERGQLRRVADVARSGIDLEARTVEVAFSSETESVERWFGVEILGHAAGEVDLSRLTNGAPLLWMHDLRDQRGVVVSARIDTDGVGRAVVKFSRSEAGEQLFQDVVDGIVTKVSVGYAVTNLQLVEERGDVPVYRITGWAPFEISMASVPADDTVGVGRSHEVRAAGASFSNSPGTNHPNAEGHRQPMNELRKLFEDALSRRPGIAHYDGDGNIRHITKQAAASVTRLSLRSTELPALVSDTARSVHVPGGTQVGKRTRLADTVLASSRARAAGTEIIIVPDAEPGYDVGGILVYPRREISFDHIAPANFVAVDDGDDVPTSPLPIARAHLDRETMAAYGFRVSLTRAERKAYRDGQLADSAMHSIAMGIGRLADRVLFQAILSTSPEAFNVAQVAALGAAWGDVRGFVGTDAAGAAPAEDGTLRASPAVPVATGIPAELTPETSATILGVWNMAAVAVAEDIALIAERTDGKGGLQLTCWCNMQALLPTPGAFWTVEG